MSDFCTSLVLICWSRYFLVSEAELSIFQSTETAWAEQVECTKITKRSATVMLKELQSFRPLSWGKSPGCPHDTLQQKRISFPSDCSTFSFTEVLLFHTANIPLIPSSLPATPATLIRRRNCINISIEPEFYLEKMSLLAKNAIINCSTQ